jgi:hypothetical protein
MKRNYQRIPQPTPEALTDHCLAFLRTKFYQENPLQFAKDRQRLLHWVVLEPTAWLNRHAATLHGDRYRAIFAKIINEADLHKATKVRYLPAWLKQVIQSHLDIHGETYLDEAKAVQNLADQVLMIAGQIKAATPDPVRELANAHQILASQKRRLIPSKRPVKQQLNLL